MIKGSKACQHHKLALWWGQGFIPAIKLGMKTVWVRQGYAVYHRLNDNEDKWIVSLNGETIPAEDILEAIGFQEQYFMGELYTL